MNFEFSDDSNLLRDQARGFLRSHCKPQVVRSLLEGHDAFARPLWDEVVKMGWPGAAIPAQYGGSEIGYEALCVIAEELGRVAAPIPFSSSIYLAAELIVAQGSEEQRQDLLSRLVDGSLIGTVAVSEGLGQPGAGAIRLSARAGILNGSKWPVPDGLVADFAIVVARDEYGIGLYKVDLAETGVKRNALVAVDPSRGQARLDLVDVKGERLGAPGDAWPVLQDVLNRAAILTAFEQIGGAEACLFMARDYAMSRFAFGRPIASFQAIKHKLADVYVAIELARSNAFYGVWALSKAGGELSVAAAAARIAAIEAFQLAARENIQTHGGIGFTWDSDCHLYYRRSKHLALTLGSAPFWKNRLVDELEVGDLRDGIGE